MRFLYKINSSYDGFTPERIPDRLVSGNRLLLGWTRYLEQVNRGDDVWVYFKGPHRFEDGVYVKGVVSAVDLAKQSVLLRVYRFRTDTPVTDRRMSERIASVVTFRYRQVFLLPPDWDTEATCDLYASASSCRARNCEWCPTWQAMARIGVNDVRAPARAADEVDGFAPAYWVIAPRGFVAARRIHPEIHRTSDVIRDFKVGNANLAFPLALGMFKALLDRDLGEFDAIVPVPLSPDKAKAGEMHRTRLLAAELGGMLGVPVRQVLSLSSPVSKRRLMSRNYTYYEFERKYEESLKVSSAIASAARILLVDDISTHGGTAKVASRALRAEAPDASIVLAVAGQMVVKHTVRRLIAVARAA